MRQTNGATQELVRVAQCDVSSHIYDDARLYI